MESVRLWEPAEHTYSPASCGKKGSMVQVLVAPLEVKLKRSALIRAETDTPSMIKVRPTLLLDAVQLAMRVSPKVTFVVDSSNVIGVGPCAYKGRIRKATNERQK